MWTRKGSVGEVVLGMCYCWVYLYKHNSTQLIPPHRPFMRKSFLLTHVFLYCSSPSSMRCYIIVVGGGLCGSRSGGACRATLLAGCWGKEDR